jgi:hypothetical protein
VYQLRADDSESHGLALRPVAGAAAPDLINSQFGIMRYVSGYVSKSDQTKPGCKVGRYWGIVGRVNIPWAKEQVIELSSDQAKLVRRTARRYMRAMNRVRRIRRWEALLPRQMCAAFMLNGDLRRFRKRCPDAKIFQQLPRKLRLKNNRNVNLFCDARFWEQGLVKPLYQKTPGPHSTLAWQCSMHTMSCPRIEKQVSTHSEV